MMHAPCTNTCKKSLLTLWVQTNCEIHENLCTAKISMYIIYMAHGGQVRNDKLFEFCRYLLVIVIRFDMMLGFSQDPDTRRTNSGWFVTTLEAFSFNLSLMYKGSMSPFPFRQVWILSAFTSRKEIFTRLFPLSWQTRRETKSLIPNARQIGTIEGKVCSGTSL